MGLCVLAPTRRSLGARLGETVGVVAKYSRSGRRTVGPRTYPTILLHDVRDIETGMLLTDHLWFNLGSTWRQLRLVAGDVVTF